MNDVGRPARKILAAALVVGGMVWTLSGDASSASLGNVRPATLYATASPVALTRAIVYDTFDGPGGPVAGRWPLMHAGAPWAGAVPGWRTDGTGSAAAGSAARSQATIEAKRSRVRVTARLLLPETKREVGVVLNDDGAGTGVVVWHSNQGAGRISIGQVRPTRVDTWVQVNNVGRPASADLVVDFDVVPCTYRIWFGGTDPVMTRQVSTAVCAASRASTKHGLYASTDTVSRVDEFVVEGR
ncbi:MAG TPA: hypothetical protein VF855_04610 [Acidimicrobiales bacterium]